MSKSATIIMLIPDEQFIHGKRVFCHVTYVEGEDGWCDVTFKGKSKPSMQLHIEDLTRLQG